MRRQTAVERGTGVSMRTTTAMTDTMPLCWRKIKMVPRAGHQDWEFRGDGEPDPEIPYGFVSGSKRKREVGIWHPKRREWCGVRGVPFESVAAAKRAVETICRKLWSNPSYTPHPRMVP